MEKIILKSWSDTENSDEKAFQKEANYSFPLEAVEVSEEEEGISNSGQLFIVTPDNRVWDRTWFVWEIAN